ncbi:MAG: type 4a pilus biogenesis protein PilO [Nitrospinaceae bacterium]|jgi:Tfp pilus assembly protein PilO
MNLNKIFDKIPYETLANFKPAHYIGMAAGFSLVIFGAMFFVAFSPNAEEKAKLEKKLAGTEKKLERYLAEGAKKEAITKQVAALFGTLGEKKRQLPLAEEIPLMIHKISDIGDFLGVDIVSFKLNPAKSEGFYKTIPMSLTIVGTYYQTAGFFDSLQNLLRMVNIESFKMDMRPAIKIVVNEDGEKKQESVQALQTVITANTFAYIEGSEKIK